jgi:phospholipid/cholesterol/gamma-HCH transport system permease protein
MDTAMETNSTRCELTFSRSAEDNLLVRLAGDWKIGREIPSPVEVEKELESEPKVERLSFDTRELKGWDSGLLTFLIKVIDQCSRREIRAEKEGLPQGVKRLLELASAVPEKKGTGREAVRELFLVRIGDQVINVGRSTVEMLAFLGEGFVAFMKLLVGRASFRRSDLTLIIQECGVQALPIVSLISVLVGLIFAFVGAVQLKMFGAQIFVANLVAIAMAREMGAMMTGIIMAGRTGAAFAAQLGTMQVNEEIDALQTLGVSPMEFLVLPRMLALVLMMPLLCIYADLMGILGGVFVGVGMLDLSLPQYIEQTRNAVGLTDFGLGVVKSSVFGILVAISGCLRGMQCGRSAASVGIAATSAVVTAIVAIIVSDGLFAVITNVLGI